MVGSLLLLGASSIRVVSGYCLESLTFSPFSFFDGATLRFVNSKSMLAAVDPVAFELATVLPLVNTVAYFLIGLVLSYIASAVFPSENAFSMHFVVVPLPSIGAAIVPRVRTLALNIVLEVFTIINGAISKIKYALAVLFPVDKVTNEV